MGDSGVRRALLAALAEAVALLGTHQHRAWAVIESALSTSPQITSCGLHPQTLSTILSGTVLATHRAHASLAPGSLALGGRVENGTIKRSPPAYHVNPTAERPRYSDAGRDGDQEWGVGVLRSVAVLWAYDHMINTSLLQQPRLDLFSSALPPSRAFPLDPRSQLLSSVLPPLRAFSPLALLLHNSRLFSSALTLLRPLDPRSHLLSSALPPLRHYIYPEFSLSSFELLFCAAPSLRKISTRNLIAANPVRRFRRAAFSKIHLDSLLASNPMDFPASFDLLGHARIGQAIWSVYQGDSKLLLQAPTPQTAPPPQNSDCSEDEHEISLPCLCVAGKSAGYVHSSVFPVPAVASGWGLIERRMYHVINAMWSITKSLLRTPQWKRFPMPYQFGYEMAYRTENAARTVAFRSLYAFLPLMGQLAMEFWYMDIYLAKYSKSDWRDQVCEEASVHPQFLADLEHSPAGDLTLPRIGGLLDFSETLVRDPSDVEITRSMDDFVGLLIESKLPMSLYINWGPIEHLRIFVPRSLERIGFFPDHLEIQYLPFSRWTRGQDRHQGAVFQSLKETEPYVLPVECMPRLPEPLPEPVSNAPFPPVEQNSGQRAGESMSKFFDRRKGENTRCEAMETVVRRRAREQQEENAARGQVPGRGGARVFEWVKSSGHFIRTAGGRPRYEELWEEYGPSQRRYDSFHNEWDLCEAFGPVDDQDSDGGDEGYDDFAPSTSTHHDKFTPSTRQDGGDDDDDDDIDAPSQLLPEREGLEEGEIVTLETQPPSADEGGVEFDCVALSFRTIVQYRYGCVVKEESGQIPPPALEYRVLPELAKRLLGDLNLQVHPNRPEELEIFCAFLRYCKAARQLEDIPRPLLDFHDLESDLHYDWVAEVRREMLGGKLYYVVYEIKSDASQPSLYVLLQSATTALEIVRQGWGPTLDEIIEKLLGRNISFNPGRPASRTPDVLGPWLSKLKSYVTIREQFLRSPRGRCAKSYSGIVGRLACTLICDAEVLRGPTDEVTVDGLCMWDGHSEYAYWDDYLTDQEIDLICGVYHISTGQRNPGALSGEQTTARSWWPRPSAMEQSGLNVGW
ncbi:hypothetical protein B0H14DRAFT_2601028 [Mycena olivaceomarginata]|nr:hypothetical protein B0H14DRAFT_2601028 [Mycena olivaceomarginata]